jgi:Protein of unknown function (DUF3800)
MNIQQIYCDESGFTGNNLLDQRDPFFAYATVAVCHEEANGFIENIIQDYRIQGGELKFGKLIKHSKGREAILKVIKNFSPYAKVAIYNKKYSLGCKFYEYIFDPLVKSKNSIFYKVGFHYFIANILYVHFETRNDFAEEIFNDFYNLMMNGDNENLIHLFGLLDSGDISPPINMIREFCITQRKSICKELISLKNNDSSTHKWILDVTQPALFALLVQWGQEFDQLEIFCDVSKPLQQQLEVFQAMIAREDKFFSWKDGKQYGFNLVKTPEFVDSKSFPGIQIADIFAGTFTCMFREKLMGRDQKLFEEWLEYLEKCISPYSVVPNYEHVNLENISVHQNYLILEELTRRSISNIPLLDGSIPGHDVHSQFSNFLFS